MKKQETNLLLRVLALSPRLVFVFITFSWILHVPTFAMSFIISNPNHDLAFSNHYRIKSIVYDIHHGYHSTFSFQLCSSLSSSSSQNEISKGIRLNKVFKATHSRREADKLISSGRVSVNDKQVDSKGGCLVIPYVDIIKLDGVVIQGWEDMNAIEKDNHDQITSENKSNKHNHKNMNTDQTQKMSSRIIINNTSTRSTYNEETKLTKSHFQYIKFYKPVGVTCTTDLKIKDNIIHSIQKNGYRSPHRIYPVGRLDKDTSGTTIFDYDL